MRPAFRSAKAKLSAAYAPQIERCGSGTCTNCNRVVHKQLCQNRREGNCNACLFMQEEQPAIRNRTRKDHFLPNSVLKMSPRLGLFRWQDENVCPIIDHLRTKRSAPPSSAPATALKIRSCRHFASELLFRHKSVLILRGGSHFTQRGGVANLPVSLTTTAYLQTRLGEH